MQFRAPTTGPVEYFTSLFRWTVKREGVIAPDERPPAGQSVALGIQHVVAMFGATVLGPALMGFNANTAIFFSGIATLLFFVIVRGQVPSYLGSSFSFIAVVVAATVYAPKAFAEPNLNLGVALGGIIAAGAAYAVIGVIVMVVGYRWVEFLMPPVVTGAIVCVIGLNLAHVAVGEAGGAASWFVNPAGGANIDLFMMSMALITVLAVVGVAVYAPGILRRLPILIGGIAGYVVYYVAANLMHMGTAINFDAVSSAAWIGLPTFTAPKFETHAVTLIAPIAIVLVAENLGHIKAVAAMTKRDLDPYIGRAFLADGLSTMIAGSGGGTGVTTYAENIGVMAVTKVYSSLIFVIAALVAILLGLCPKFGAVIGTIPTPVIGGLAIVLFGLIAATGIRILIENRVNLLNNRNLVTLAVALTMGAGDLTVNIGDFSLGGIGTATLAAIVVYQLLGLVKTAPESTEDVEVETPARTGSVQPKPQPARAQQPKQQPAKTKVKARRAY